MPEPASEASTFTVTSPSTSAPSAGEVSCAVGAVASILIVCSWTGSTSPAELQERNLTVVVSETVNGPVYSGEVSSGSVPSSV